jgi:hypothetical protein
MQYLVTARKAILLDGVTYYPGNLLEDPSNPGQLIRRGLAVPFGTKPTTEQAATSSPSSEPAPTPSSEEGGGEGEAEVEAEVTPEETAVEEEETAPEEEPKPAARKAKASS